MAAETREVWTTVERRRSPRAPVTVRVEYGTVDAMFSEFTRNINEGGLFVETDSPLELDERVQLQFRLPGGQDSIKVTGRVARIETDGELSGMGIEFEHLDTEARRCIDELVRQLRAFREG